MREKKMALLFMSVEVVAFYIKALFSSLRSRDGCCGYRRCALNIPKTCM